MSYQFFINPNNQVKAPASILCCIILTFTLGYSSFAYSDQSRSGGDIDLIKQRENILLREQENNREHQYNMKRRAELEHLIFKGEIGERLKAFVSMIDEVKFEDKKSDDLRQLINRAVSNGLLTDIEKANYLPKENFPNQRCEDEEGNQTSISTKLGSMENPRIGEEICVDLDLIIEQLKDDRSKIRYIPYIVGLFLHDHLKHFGEVDKDHNYAFMIQKAFKKLPFGYLVHENVSDFGIYYEYNERGIDFIEGIKFYFKLNLDEGAQCSGRFYYGYDLAQGFRWTSSRNNYPSRLQFNLKLNTLQRVNMSNEGSELIIKYNSGIKFLGFHPFSSHSFDIDPKHCDSEKLTLQIFDGTMAKILEVPLNKINRKIISVPKATN